ncbi:MAG TPA: VOC family protein [Thermoanaerobaculia bacterium]|jgi:catechol 2,3-dioxygenase-like lactoylglutathione lyase family enzyme
MSTTEVRSQGVASDAKTRTVDMKLEVVEIPVADGDRAAKFYKSLGWRQDVTPPGSGIFQLTPPGSACSVQWGAGRTAATPGSAQGLWLIVSDILAALEKLSAAGAAADEIFHIGAKGKESGLDPERGSYRSFASFRDPDGNRWLLQEITTRLPGRIDSGITSYGSAADLANAMRRAEAAHGEHEKRTGVRDANWSDWYAEYMAAEQSGAKLPE